MSVEPSGKAGAREIVAYGVELNASAYEHHNARKHGGETHSHLVEDDTCKDKEEHVNVEEHLCALHTAERLAVPSAGVLHQVLDGGQNVHKYITAKHGQSQ